MRKMRTAPMIIEALSRSFARLRRSTGISFAEVGLGFSLMMRS